MFESAYEAVTPYEAGMMKEQNPASFNRVYENMRHTLRRRKATLEKYGRTDTAGYERLKEALETTRGTKSAENFSALSRALNTKYTKYSEQVKAERRFAENIRQKYGVTLKPDEIRRIMGRLNEALNTKQGRLKYQERNSEFWQTAIKARDKKMSKKKFMQLVNDL